MRRWAAVRGLSLVLAAGLLGACSDARPGEGGVMASWEEVAQGPAALELPGPVKVWAAERSPRLGVYYVLCAAPVLGPNRQARSALRIVLLKGRARLRVGDVARESGPGAYAVAPAAAVWSVERLDREPAVLAVFAAPDVADLAGLLRPAPPQP